MKVGAVCVDKYEASVWSTTDTTLIKRIQQGKIAGAGDLGAAVQHGAVGDDYGAGCDDTGNGCKDDYAVSIPSVIPSGFVTWFQAAAACRNAGKRLATNQEWQMAALGTPDPGSDDGTTDCNVFNTLATTNTGSRSSCVSDVGAWDTVGNLDEWVADWADAAANCSILSPTYGADISCVGGDGTVNVPGALIRGGNIDDGSDAGVFAVFATLLPSDSGAGIGFRCAR